MGSIARAASRIHKMVARRMLRAIIDAWIAVQVELHGQYSLERLRRFHAFASTPRSLWLLLLCAITPIPCLLLNTVMDFVHIRPPSEGRAANHLFWARFFVSLIVITFGVLMQFVHLIPRLGVTRQHILLFSIVTSSVCTGFSYAIAGVIAFPVPFTLLVGTPPWFTCNSVMFLYFYGRRLRQDESLMKAFVRTMAILMCQIGLTIVYPIYILGLVTIPSRFQSVYVVLMPVIKIAAKNAISAFVGSNHDMKPEVVIFNVEISNALYVSLAMQNSSNVSTTLILFAIDFAQAWATMADVYREHRHLSKLMSKFPDGHPLRGKNFLEVARRLLEDDAAMTDEMLCEEPNGDRNNNDRGSDGEDIALADGCEVPTDDGGGQLAKSKEINLKPSLKHPSRTAVKSKGGVRVIPVTRVPSRHSIGDKIKSQLSMAKVTSGATAANGAKPMPMAKGDTKRRLLGQVFTEHEHIEFLRVSTQLLSTIEFIILTEYTEVIVPFVYSQYITAMFYLPNRAYYPQVADIDTVELGQMVKNVLVYAGLELLSFLAMGVLLKRAVGVSALHQLEFVLQTQWEMVQSKLLLWTFYSVQNTLEHFGADFSFQFAWMGSKSE